jgi:hypothetical protein
MLMTNTPLPWNNFRPNQMVFFTTKKKSQNKAEKRKTIARVKDKRQRK